MTEEETAPIAENVETTTGEDVKIEEKEEKKPEEVKTEETNPEETKPTEAEKAAAKAEKKAAKVSYENRELRRQLKSNADQMTQVMDAIKKNTPQAKEPDIGNFEKLEEYLDARDKFVKQQETPKEPDNAEYQQYFTESRQEMIDNGAEKYDDFELVITDDKVKLSMAMCDALFMVDDPELQADVAYYLGKNPKETLRIAKLPDQRQYAAIGRLEAKFDAKPAKKRTSTAPEPVEPVGAGSTPSDEIRDQEGIKDYIRKRNKQRGLS